MDYLNSPRVKVDFDPQALRAEFKQELQALRAEMDLKFSQQENIFIQFEIKIFKGATIAALVLQAVLVFGMMLLH